MSRTRTLLPLLGLAVATACGTSLEPASSGPAGTYNGLVTGGITRSLDGAARLVRGVSGYARPTIEILLGADGASDRIVLTLAADRVPAPGLYEITGYSSEPVEGKWIGAYLSSSNTVRGTFLAVSGEVRITQSRNNRLRGTVTLYADGLPEGSNTALFLEFSGSFDAIDKSR